MIKAPIIAIMWSGLVAVAAALVLQGCTTGTPDSEIGLSKTSVFDTPSPAPVAENETMPGETEVIPRDNSEGPPAIPHGIGDFLPITASENLCVDCHALEEKVEGGPTPIPQSHYVDMRNAPDEPGDELAGARYVCISCHVSLTETTPLVPNTASP
jgi:nitrate reductase cytochrome c-type subunit